MRLPQIVPIEWLALAALVAAGFVMVVLTFVPATGGVSVVGPGRARSGKLRRRACRAFADAVASGDLEGADVLVARALGPAGSEPTPSGVRDPLLDVVEWDERKLFAVGMDDVRRQFQDPAASSFWFMGIERVAHDGRVDLVLGPWDPIRLTLVSEVWSPEGDGLSFTAACAGFQISGYLTFRTVLARAMPTGEMESALEVWVHMETTDSPDGRRALARARGVVHDGLGRMAAELNPL
jgi:hypothetical protein